jgi:hypothetical protein
MGTLSMIIINVQPMNNRIYFIKYSIQHYKKMIIMQIKVIELFTYIYGYQFLFLIIIKIISSYPIGLKESQCDNFFKWN